MNYALIENGTVANIIWLHPMNANEFSNAVLTNELPIQVGDAYQDGKFYHEGKEITLTPTEQTYTLDEAAAILASEVNEK